MAWTQPWLARSDTMQSSMQGRCTRLTGAQGRRRAVPLTHQATSADSRGPPGGPLGESVPALVPSAVLVLNLNGLSYLICNNFGYDQSAFETLGLLKNLVPTVNSINIH